MDYVNSSGACGLYLMPHHGLETGSRYDSPRISYRTAEAHSNILSDRRSN